MYVYLLIGLGGALGGVARYWLSGTVARLTGESFPWGTLAVNASGALLIGLVAALLDGDAFRVFAFGVLGSYTTVSSFSLQTLALLRDGRAGAAACNIALSFVLCLCAAATGMLLGTVAGARL